MKGARLNANYLMAKGEGYSGRKKCLVCRKMLKHTTKKKKTKICSRCQIDFNSRYSSSWLCLINYFGKKVDEAYNKGLKVGSESVHKANNKGDLE